jgi:outer membrane protein assembly factor BamD
MPLKKQFLFFCLLVLLGSCSNYQKALRSDDVGLKYKLAEQYYKKGDYQRAVPFYDELVSLYKGTSEAEDVYFKYADCYYHLGEYVLSSFHFKYFAESFPLSPKAEEAFYLYAYSLYQQSPIIEQH